MTGPAPGPAPASGTNAYDSAPYPWLAYAPAHPARMAAIAHLMGVPVGPVQTARVLEVGSAVGGHLLPMATAFPEARFTGFDLAEEQVARATAAANELGLTNVHFLQADIRGFEPEPGTFDFVIAHGIYSWVPPDVRDALLRLVAHALSPEGVGYVSYNTFPGWHGLMAVRRVLELGAGSNDDPVERARAGLENLQFVRELLPDDSSVRPFLEWYSQVEGQRVSVAGDNHLVLVTHDELSEYNDPVYFLDFVDHAARHGLRHLADADISSSFPHRLSSKQIESINRRVHSAEEFEQYLDFVADRTFRRSLLVKQAEKGHRLGARPERLRGLWIRSRARPDDAPDEGDRMAFRSPDDARIETTHPLSVAAFLHLIEIAPAEIRYEDLVDAAARRAGGQIDANDEALLAANLVSAFTHSSELVDLRAAPSGVVTEPGPRPRIDPYVRWMAGRRETLLTNRYFDRVPVKPVMDLVLSLLDGSRTIDEAAEAAGAFLERRMEGPGTDLRAAVAEVVQVARDSGLLVAPL